MAVAQDDEMDDEVVAVRVGNGHSQLVQSSGDHDLKPYLPPQHTRAQRSPSGSDGTVDSGSSVKGDGRLDDDEHIGSPAGSDDTEDSAVALKDNGNLGRNEKFEPPSGIEGVNVLGADAGIDAGIDVEKVKQIQCVSAHSKILTSRSRSLNPRLSSRNQEDLDIAEVVFFHNTPMSISIPSIPAPKFHPRQNSKSELPMGEFPECLPTTLMANTTAIGTKTVLSSSDS